MSAPFQSPKDYAMALHKLAAAQAIADREHAIRTAHLDGARRAIQAQWDRWNQDYTTHLVDIQLTTPKETSDKIRRSFERQRRAVEKLRRQWETGRARRMGGSLL